MKAAAQALGHNLRDRLARRKADGIRRASGNPSARAASHALRRIAGREVADLLPWSLPASLFFQAAHDALGWRSDLLPRFRALEAISAVRESFIALVAGPADGIRSRVIRGE